MGSRSIDRGGDWRTGTGELTGVGPTHTAGEFGGAALLAMSEAVGVCRD